MRRALLLGLVLAPAALLPFALRRARHSAGTTEAGVAAGAASAPAATAPVAPMAPQDSVARSGPTVIEVGPAVLHERVLRLGLNLGSEDYYDSLQVLKNLVSRNPGFEGREWQSVLRCGQPGVNSCTGGPNSGAWPEGFLDGGTYEVLSGAAKGMTGKIVHSTAGTDHVGTTLQFALAEKGAAAGAGKGPAAGDYLAVRKATPGDAAGAWDAQVYGGAKVSTELKDLSPRTPGSQALRVQAHGPGQYAYLKEYFGGAAVRMRGPYVLRFRAKGVSAGSSLTVSVEEPGVPLFRQVVVLENNWRDYSFDFTAAEPPEGKAGAALVFTIEQAEVLLDDVSLAEGTPNGTPFRNDVVATLRRLRPGVLRYMDTGQNWGSSLENMLAPEHARRRSGYNLYLSEPNDIPIGLNDFLLLCEKVGAEPWYTIQMGWGLDEAAGLMEFLGGPVTTKYGAARAALGHPVPWTKTFPAIHLEYGNEAWNEAQPGETMSDAVAYSERATAVFGAIRSSQWYAPGRVDLIANGQAGNIYLNAKVLETARGMDTIDIAPYFFNTFADDSSIEHVFGPMFAEPEMMDSAATGYVQVQAAQARKAGLPGGLAVYETNIDSVAGTASQASLDAAVPSVGAGIASVDHMLLMLRDDGIRVQNTYQLGGGTFGFNNTAGVRNEKSPIWGIVIDMGGATNRVRPSFLAQQLANEAIRPTMLSTSIGGYNPTWDQPLSANDKVELKGAHELQSFAFSDKETVSTIVFNLSRTARRDVALSGACAPQGTVTVKTLTSGKITDSNETAENVKIVSREEREVVPGRSRFDLPPFSMTVLSSANKGCVPEKGQ